MKHCEWSQLGDLPMPSDGDAGCIGSRRGSGGQSKNIYAVASSCGDYQWIHGDDGDGDEGTFGCEILRVRFPNLFLLSIKTIVK